MGDVEAAQGGDVVKAVDNRIAMAAKRFGGGLDGAGVEIGAEGVVNQLVFGTKRTDSIR